MRNAVRLAEAFESSHAGDRAMRSPPADACAVFSSAPFLNSRPSDQHDYRAGADALAEAHAGMSYLVVFLIVGFLILAHELGHYVVARVLGIPVARFSIGLGRPLLSMKRGSTEYVVGLFPFGGYVLPHHTDYFAQTPMHRLLFALGGPAANIVMTFLLMGMFNVTVYGWSTAAVLTEPLRQTLDAVALVGTAMPKAFAGMGQAVGPLGVLAQGGEFVGSSFVLGLQFAAVMSVNLALINLVPIPPLDGGRILLCSMELVWERAERLHVPMNIAGFVALMGFLSWVTLHDLRRFVARFFA